MTVSVTIRLSLIQQGAPIDVTMAPFLKIIPIEFSIPKVIWKYTMNNDLEVWDVLATDKSH